jgi:putative peptidoglycan lipid II flippase
VTSSRALARAGLIVSGAFLVSRILGWLRVLVIGNTFAAGPELDAFVAAFRLPDLLFQLVAAGALSSAVIPVVSALLAGGETARAWRVVSTIANLMVAGLLALGVIVFVAAPWIVPAIIAPGWDDERWSRTVDLTRIMLLSPIFLSLGSLASSALNARGRFAASAIAPIVYNLAIIGAALLLTPALGVTGLALGVVAGSLGHLLVQIPPLRGLGFVYDRSIALDDPDARHALKLLGPRALGLGAGQITFVILNSIASTIATGAVTVFYVAFTLLQIPIGLVGVPLGIVVLPSLSRVAALGDLEQFAGLMSRAIRLIVFTMIPITGIAIVVRHDLVDVLFGSGKFDRASLDLTAATLEAFLVGLTAHALIAVLARAFYARHDTRTPVAAAILAVVINSSLGGILAGPLGLPGLGLAIAIAAWVEAIVLLVLLRRGLPELAVRPIVSLAFRSFVVAVGASAAALGVDAGLGLAMGPDPGRLGLAVRLSLVGVVWLLTSAAVAVALRIEELGSMIRLMLDLLRRPRAA